MDGWKILVKNKKIIQTLPFLAFMIVFYLYGIYYGIKTSFGYNSIMGESGFTLENYRYIFSDKGFLSSIIFTLRISLISAVIGVLTTQIILYIIYINMKENYFLPDIFQKLVELPLLVPYIIAGYAILLVFMQSGLLSELLVKLGVLENYQGFPVLTNERQGIGIIITYIWKSIPFIIMTCTPVLKRILNKWDSLGKVYNLSSFQFYIKIIFPIMLPTVIISFFMIFSYFIVSFEAPYLLGVTSPKSIAVYIFDFYRMGGLEKRGVVMGMNVILLGLNLGSGYIIYRLFRSFSKYGEGGWE